MLSLYYEYLFWPHRQNFLGRSLLVRSYTTPLYHLFRRECIRKNWRKSWSFAKYFQNHTIIINDKFPLLFSIICMVIFYSFETEMFNFRCWICRAVDRRVQRMCVRGGGEVCRHEFRSWDRGMILRYPSPPLLLRMVRGSKRSFLCLYTGKCLGGNN